jgi:(p)ppGpp synthase/HD superfamily hydrolase
VTSRDTGYSDRINHALAFAAKHHDQQVRRGVRLPYATHAANTAVILSRYDRDDDTVVAGILYGVIADYLIAGYTMERLSERIGDKFGTAVLETVLQVAERRFDAEGVELSPDERKADLSSRLADASENALWVFAAERLHNCASLLADLRRTEFRETVWMRLPHGRDNTIKSFRQVHDRLRDVGFRAPIVAELAATIDQLDATPS